jgi:hypothetical protein
MRRMVLVVTVSMLAMLAFVSKSAVVEAQTSLGTFTFTANGGSHSTMTVDTFSEVTNAPAGGWTVQITKDVDVTTPALHQIETSGTTLTSARVTISGVTRRFQTGTITGIQSVAAIVPRELVTISFATSN